MMMMLTARKFGQSSTFITLVNRKKYLSFWKSSSKEKKANRNTGGVVFNAFDSQKVNSSLTLTVKISNVTQVMGYTIITTIWTTLVSGCN